MGNNLKKELAGLHAVTATRSPGTVLIIGSAFPDPEEGIFEPSVQQNEHTQSIASLTRSASPVSSTAFDEEEEGNGEDDDEKMWPTPTFEQVVRLQLDFMRGAISNELVDIILIGGGLVQLVRSAIASMGPGADTLIEDPGPPMSLNEDDEENGEEGEDDEEEGEESLEYESTNLLTSQSVPSNAAVEEKDESPRASEASPRDSDGSPRDSDGSPRDSGADFENEDEDEFIEFGEENENEDPNSKYFEEIIELFCLSRQKGIAWRLPLDALVGLSPPSRPTSDAALALMHDSVYDGGTSTVSFEDPQYDALLDNYFLDIGQRRLSDGGASLHALPQ